MRLLCRCVDDPQATGVAPGCLCSWDDDTGAWEVRVDRHGIAWTIFHPYKELPF